MEGEGFAHVAQAPFLPVLYTLLDGFDVDYKSRVVV
jgi:hypothetical protein